MTVSDDIRRRLDAAVRLAQEGGRSTLALFESFAGGAGAFDRKPDGSEVTAADRGCEQLLRRRIEESFPGDGVIGEEFGESPGRTGYRWVLDPIDGTASFIRGVPMYGTLVAVEHEGKVIAGSIYMPALDEIVFAGEGGGAWHRVRAGAEHPARVSTTKSLGEALILTTSSEYFRRVNSEAAWNALSARAKRTRGWSDCYAHVLVATGRADASVEPSLHVWDITPARVIIREAGGTVTDWTGSDEGPRGWHRQALATNGAVHPEAVEVLRPYARRDNP
jgi:histidinol-phosphatase